MVLRRRRDISGSHKQEIKPEETFPKHEKPTPQPEPPVQPKITEPERFQPAPVDSEAVETPEVVDSFEEPEPISIDDNDEEQYTHQHKYDSSYSDVHDEDSPGEKAGLRVGDVIVEVSGRRVRSPQEILNILNEKNPRPGDSLEIKLVRSNRLFETSLRLERPREN